MVLSDRANRILGLGMCSARKKRFYRALLAEYVGTSVFVFCAAGSVVIQAVGGVPTLARNLTAGFIQGLSITALVAACAGTSGGHLNPAVTLGLMVSGDHPVLHGLAYIILQLAGGITGAAILSGVMPGQIEGTLGTTQLANGISRFQGYVFESMVTFLLVFVVFGTAVDRRSEGTIRSLSPVPIGFALVAGVTLAFSFTGGSLNPARTFGPAVISDTWDSNYIYWFGPFTGAIFAALIFKYVIYTKPSDEEVTEQQARFERHKHGGYPIDATGNVGNTNTVGYTGTLGSAAV